MIFALAACRVTWGVPEAADCEGDAPSGDVWIYTSIYPEVVAKLDADLRRRFPGLEPHFLQAGSEKVALRYEAELAAGGSPACVLATSDPAWIDNLARRGVLIPHLAPNVLHLAREHVHPDGLWTTLRHGLVVLGTHSDVADAPQSFADLMHPRFAGRLSSGDPSASGSAFTLWSTLVHDQGWPYVEALDDAGLIAAGGNGAVLARIASRERDVGLLLLENLLDGQRRGDPVTVVFPSDGAVLVPGPIAIPAGCPNPLAARAVIDTWLSPEGQALLVDGGMYAVLPGLPPPTGAPPLGTVAVRPFGPDRLDVDGAAFKARFLSILDGP